MMQHIGSRLYVQLLRHVWVTALLVLLLLLSTLAAGSNAAVTINTAAPPTPATSYSDAVQLYSKAIRIHDKTQAIELYRESIERHPLAQAYNNLGLLLAEDACDHCRDRANARAAALEVLAQGARVALETNETETFVAIESNIGFLLRASDMKSVALCLEAIEHYDRALAVDPDHVNTLFNKASALYEMRALDAAEQLNRRILELESQHIGASTDLSLILFFTRRDIPEAIRLQDVVVASTGSIELQRSALVNKAMMLRSSERFVLAHEAAAQAYALSPDHPIALATLVLARRPLCVWEHLQTLHDALLAHAMRELSASYGAVSLTPFESTLLPVTDSLRKHLAIASARELEQKATLTLAPPSLLDASTPVATASQPERALRVGYLSYDFRDHAMGQLVLGFLELHDTRAVESICYSYGPNDGTEWRQRAETSCSTFRDVRALSDLDAAAQIARDRVDVLVDLMGFTTGARGSITALKPSHVVVNYLGYPGTTGSATTDYVVLDRFVVPPEHARTAMTEQVVYLPTTYQSNRLELEPQSCIESTKPQDKDVDDLDTDADAYEPPCCLATRQAHGLPPSPVVVFANFNTLNKMEPQAFSVWMRILHQVPASVLWLLHPGKTTDARAIMRTLELEAQALGVHASRIVFAPWTSKQAHHARLALADVFLDTFVYTAHSTATDVLHTHVPLVTLWGSAFPSRVSASLMRNALPLLPDLAAHSMKDYERIAVLLGRHRTLRARLRRELAAQALASPLFDSKRTTTHLEAAYAIMHDLTHRVEPGAQDEAHHKRKTRFQVLVHPEASRHTTSSMTRDRDAANTNARVQLTVDAGLRHQQRGELAVAQYFYTRALQTESTHADALHLLATVHFASGRIARARRLLDRVVKLQPDVVLYRMNAALVHISIGERASAVEQVRADNCASAAQVIAPVHWHWCRLVLV